jgi:simple sugar transport system ATP-binding protein
MVGNHTRDEITLDELTRQMAGGSDLEALRHELQRG